jgi:hypothetical protein
MALSIFMQISHQTFVESLGGMMEKARTQW